MLSLWCSFARYCVLELVRLRWPLTIRDHESVGRELFTGQHYASTTGRVKPGAFYPPKHRRDVSVNRMTLVTWQNAVLLGRRHAEKRNLSFHGFAELAASDVRQAQLTIEGRITAENPFHGNIYLPPDIGRDAMLDFARRLAERAKFRSAG
jgi:hypothetical protein